MWIGPSLFHMWHHDWQFCATYSEIELSLAAVLRCWAQSLELLSGHCDSECGILAAQWREHFGMYQVVGQYDCDGRITTITTITALVSHRSWIVQASVWWTHSLCSLWCVFRFQSQSVNHRRTATVAEETRGGLGGSFVNLFSQRGKSSTKCCFFILSQKSFTFGSTLE